MVSLDVGSVLLFALGSSPTNAMAPPLADAPANVYDDYVRRLRAVGVAALGFGTETIPQVRKIVGPGSPPVACAQVEMQRYGVATMMILGPTESVVIADDSADPVFTHGVEDERGTQDPVMPQAGTQRGTPPRGKARGCRARRPRARPARRRGCKQA